MNVKFDGCQLLARRLVARHSFLHFIERPDGVEPVEGF